MCTLVMLAVLSCGQSKAPKTLMTVELIVPSAEAGPKPRWVFEEKGDVEKCGPFTVPSVVVLEKTYDPASSPFSELAEADYPTKHIPPKLSVRALDGGQVRERTTG